MTRQIKQLAVLLGLTVVSGIISTLIGAKFDATDISPKINEVAQVTDKTYFVYQVSDEFSNPLTHVRITPTSRWYELIQKKEALRPISPELVMRKRAAEALEDGKHLQSAQWTSLLNSYQESLNDVLDKRAAELDVLQLHHELLEHTQIFANEISRNTTLTPAGKQKLYDLTEPIIQYRDAMALDMASTSSATYDLRTIRSVNESGKMSLADNKVLAQANSVVQLSWNSDTKALRREEITDQQFVLHSNALYLQIHASPSAGLSLPEQVRLDRVERLELPRVVDSSKILFGRSYRVENFSQSDFMAAQAAIPYMWQLKANGNYESVDLVFWPGILAVKGSMVGALLIATVIALKFLSRRLPQLLGFGLALKSLASRRVVNIFRRTGMGIPELRVLLCTVLALSTLWILFFAKDLGSQEKISFVLLAVIVLLMYKDVSALIRSLILGLFSLYSFSLLFLSRGFSEDVLQVSLVVVGIYFIAKILRKLIQGVWQLPVTSLRKDLTESFGEGLLPEYNFSDQQLKQLRALFFFILQIGVVINVIWFTVKYLSGGQLMHFIQFLFWLPLFFLLELLVLFVISSRKLIFKERVLVGMTVCFFLLALSGRVVTFHFLQRIPLVFSMTPEQPIMWDEVNLKGRNFKNMPFKGKVLVNGKEHRIVRWTDTLVTFVVDPILTESGEVQLFRDDGRASSRLPFTLRGE